MIVLLEPIEGVASVSAGLWVKTGSRNEQNGQMGYAHFIEHMLFKGTSNHSARDIARMVDRVGGQHNAATNREYTCYYINVISDYLELSVDLLADMYYRSLFDADEISKEKNVILEEIRMYEDTPDELIHDVFMECMLSDHPLGHPILGTLDSIDGIDRNRLLDFFAGNYSTENCIFAVAGNFNVDETKRLIERAFSPSLLAANAAAGDGNALPRRIFRRHITRDLEQIHFCLGTEGLGRNDENRWTLFSLSTILGGSMSSRLFQNIREREGLCYAIYSFHSAYRDNGVFGVYCGTSPDNYARALGLIVKECESLLDYGVTDEELCDAKTFMKGNLALSMESTEVRMGHLAKNEMIYGRHFSFDEMIEKIEAISMDDFSRVIDTVFRGKQLTLVSIGRIPGNTGPATADPILLNGGERLRYELR
ncbi:MAG TPA: pitrilysin family protein [Spirochaetota bacterium]|nr:pitrilysin family protein [Spirochaetota bacterium]